MFDHDDDCSDSFPIVFDNINKRSLKHWDFISTLHNVTFDGKKIMTASAASETGVPDIVTMATFSLDGAHIRNK